MAAFELPMYRVSRGGGRSTFRINSDLGAACFACRPHGASYVVVDRLLVRNPMSPSGTPLCLKWVVNRRLAGMNMKLLSLKKGAVHG